MLVILKTKQINNNLLRTSFQFRVISATGKHIYAVSKYRHLSSIHILWKMKGLIVLGVLLLGSGKTWIFLIPIHDIKFCNFINNLACSAASFALQIEDLTQNYSPIIDLFNAADDVLFYLFTNDGPSSGVEIPFKSFNASTLAGTTFNSSNPTRILIHGFLNGFLISTMYEIRDAYLKRGNFNIVRSY